MKDRISLKDKTEAVFMVVNIKMKKGDLIKSGNQLLKVISCKRIHDGWRIGVIVSQ